MGRHTDFATIFHVSMQYLRQALIDSRDCHCRRTFPLCLLIPDLLRRHSLTAALSQFEGNRFVFISPEDLRLPQYVKNESLEPTHQIYKETADLEAELPHLDVL